VPESVGAVDAGVILTRLDPRRRGHARTVTLFDVSARGGGDLCMSVVNLAEALEHARPTSKTRAWI
jgi:hypothetical protein